MIFKIFQFRFLVFPLLYHCDLPWLSSVLFFMGIASYQEFSMHNFSERFSDIQKARKNRGFRTQIFSKRHFPGEKRVHYSHFSDAMVFHLKNSPKLLRKASPFENKRHSAKLLKTLSI